jgi:hypothetical protein
MYDLYKELAVLFSDRGKMEFKDLFSQEKELNQIAYLADMNQQNVSLQGHNLSVIDSYDKI